MEISKINCVATAFLRYHLHKCRFPHRINICQNYVTSTAEKIIIPPRIERNSTDILKALAATVKPDPTAAHFKYHDDPYLIPKSNMGKRTFAMAQEAGRKAAIWIRQQHPDLFQQTLSDPPIKSFLPQQVFNEQSEVNEDILNEVIQNVQVADACMIYNLLKSKDVQISRATQQALLELLCFYNCEDPMGEEFIEERWFSQENRGKERQRKTWKDNSLAEQLFTSMDPPDSASYSAIIQGMAKYCQVDKAWQHFETSQSKNIPVTREVYNNLIRVASFMREGYDLRWKFIQELLTNMKQQKINPNLDTLNAILDAISSFAGSRQAKNYILSTLAEFKNLGIEPSLASWYFILITLCRDRGARCGVLNDIMNTIENKDFQIRDIKDTSFFVTAMDVCRNHLQDINLARRVDKLLHTGDNYDLIGDSYKESVYYRHFFALMCKTEPLEVFMEFYDCLVPNIYTPEPGVMVEVLRAIELNGAIDILPRIWSDMIMFDHTDRENLLVLVLNIMVEFENVVEDLEKRAQLLNIAWEIYTKIDEQYETKNNRINFTGHILSNILTMCVREKDFEKSCTIMKRIETDSNIIGQPDFKALEAFGQLCIDEKEPSKAISVVQYCVDAGFTEAGLLARHIVKTMTLDESYITRLVNIVGKDVLQISQVENLTEESQSETNPKTV